MSIVAADTMSQRSGLRLQSGSLRFTFDGRVLEGRPGDTVASALLAQGVRLFARSIKYRRRRGVFTAGIDEPSALVTIGSPLNAIPNAPAPVVALRDGLQVRSQNRWPSLHYDAFSCLGLGGSLLSAGFYYKTFKWPSWRAYEPFIRRLAGFGTVPQQTALSSARIEHVNCDVLVVGSGPAGLEAARVAASAGARVVLCEREPVCGGEIEFEGAVIAGVPGVRWLTNSVTSLKRHGVRILTDTAVVGSSGSVWVAHCYPGGLPHDHRTYRIRASATVIATGAIEHGIVFAENDRPGVMLLGAAEKYLARYGALAGSRLVLFGNHERLYAAAARFLAAGAGVTAVVDTRDAGFITTDRAPLRQAGVRCLAGHTVLTVTGGSAVSGTIVAPVEDASRRQRIDCDGLLISGGWWPSRLARIIEDSGAGTLESARASGPPPSTGCSGSPSTIVCGAAAGRLALATALTDGHSAGRAAAQAVLKQEGVLSLSVQSDTRFTRSGPSAAHGDPDPGCRPYWRSPCPTKAEKRQFVDLQNDVTVADLRQALAEGFVDIEHVKRYTTLGVGTEQGSVSASIGAAIVAQFEDSSNKTARPSRSRPPAQPVTLGTLARARYGSALRPERRTPLHEWHLANGGVLEQSGLWLRPRYYRKNGPNAQAAGIREASQTRARCGLFDASTLGKFEIAGSSAHKFLQRLYLTPMRSVGVRRGRYGVLLREDGMVLDDGIVLHAASDRFVAMVSTTHAELVLAHMEFWRAAEFSGQEVVITDLTDAASVVVVAGPASRRMLPGVLGAVWESAVTNLKHMEFTEGEWNQRPLRLLRASFSGELAFELHCHPASALPLWEELMGCGAAPYGLEALDILRLEKGYLVSAEINGQTTPQDLNIAIPAECHCIGSELLARPAFNEPERPRLVGLQGRQPTDVFSAGAQLVEAHRPGTPCGYITSAAHSPWLGRQVGLALVARRIPRDSELWALDPLRGRQTQVRVTAPCQVDPLSERMNS